jgi:hypothetical protein
MKTKRFSPPDPEELELQAAKIGLPQIEAQKFFCYYESKGWLVGRSPMKNWKSAMAHWKLTWQERHGQGGQKASGGMRILLAHEEFKRVEAKMKAIRDSYSEHQSWSAEDREKFASLRDRKAQLKQILGMQV